LTPMGKELAEDIYHKHTMLLKFFRDILGVESDEAERDACIMEHYLGDSALTRLAKFVEFIEAFEKKGVKPKWLEHFKNYVETGELPQCRHLKGLC
ncbi:MAG: metal-dependent transcriptional regulator, partial [Deferribacteres bacterium]|nr:metal-dependent transcriptional regulator [Deferribacteres bacterium]